MMAYAIDQSLPAYWTNSSGSGSSYEEFLKNADKATFNMIQGVIKSTWKSKDVGAGKDAKELDHTGIKVTSVKRVENAALYRAYLATRNRMLQHPIGRSRMDIIDIPPSVESLYKKRRNKEVNEYYLFHGTPADALKEIVEKGLDPKKTNPNSLFGQGVYFTEKMNKADQYTDDINNRDEDGEELTVLLCRVLLGKPFLCSKEDARHFKSPPCMTCTLGTCSCDPHNRYDSVLGNGTDMKYREFVVYERTQSYPEYIITYQRVGTQSKKPKSKRQRKGKSVTTRTLAQAVESVNRTHAEDENFNPISKLNELYQKAKSVPPKYEFELKSTGLNRSVECFCTVQFLYYTDEGHASMKKVAKRSAAEKVWEKINLAL